MGTEEPGRPVRRVSRREVRLPGVSTLRFGHRSAPRLHSGVFPLTIPLPPDVEEGWKSYGIFKGSTRRVHRLSCHVTTQAHGVSPHPPHSHKEEEILLLLTGEIDVVIPEADASRGDRRLQLQPGQLSYYPAFFAHTVETTSEESADYLVLRWFNRKRTFSPAAKRFGIFDITFDETVMDAFASRLVFKAPTRYLKRLRCHTTVVSPGRGQDSHIDDYEVVIALLQGELETLGETVGAHSVILYAAGEPHGMRNAGHGPTRFVVFEFHGLKAGIISRLVFATWSLFTRGCRKALRLMR